MCTELKGAGLSLPSRWVHLMTVVLGIAAAYFLTIQSLKIELAAKAEGVVVSMLDKKLANLEVVLTESAVTKGQFYQFSHDMEARLAKIEFILTDQSGDRVGKE